MINIEPRIERRLEVTTRSSNAASSPFAKESKNVNELLCTIIDGSFAKMCPPNGSVLLVRV